MDGKKLYPFAKACNDHKITIYPKPSNLGKYKIIININGTEKVGQEIFENEPTTRIVKIKTPTGEKILREKVPSVWDKIAELYELICKK